MALGPKVTSCAEIWSTWWWPLAMVLQGVWPQIMWRPCDVDHSYIYAIPRGELNAGEEHRVASLQPLLISGGQVHKGWSALDTSLLQRWWEEPSGAVLFTGFGTSENYCHLQATDPSSPIVQGTACSTTTQKVWSSSSIIPERDREFLKTWVWIFLDVGQFYWGIFTYCTVCPPTLNISVVFSIVKTQGLTCQSVLDLSP